MTRRTAFAAARLASLIVTAAMITSCTALGLDGGTSQRAQLERQKARWARQNISSYRFTYDVACFCHAGNGPIEIEVRDDLITTAAWPQTDEPVPLAIVNSLPTVDALFRIIDRAIAQKVDLLEVSYHPVMGYPTRIAVDYAFNLADDEIVHLASDLTPIRPD